MTALYIGTRGERLQVSGQSDLNRLLLESDDDYWEAGSGEVELQFSNEELQSFLGLKRVPDSWFRFFYRGAS